jgi:hypothetical protein
MVVLVPDFADLPWFYFMQRGSLKLMVGEFRCRLKSYSVDLGSERNFVAQMEAFQMAINK